MKAVTLVVWSFAFAATLGSIAKAETFEIYRATGVAAGDALAVRDEPWDGGKLSDWNELGRIPSNATSILGTGRSKQIGTQRWSEISFGTVRGWVNSKFLEATYPAVADLKRETFDCFGTEPFWGATLAEDGSEYSNDPEFKGKLTVERIEAPRGRTMPILFRLTDASGRKLQAIVSHEKWCSDDMSDYDYSFQVLISDENEFLSGCCTLKR